MVFGLVIGALLLVPLLVVCGSSSSGDGSVFSSTTDTTTEGDTASAAELVRQAVGGVVTSESDPAAETAGESAVLSAAAEPETYTVQAGDSLWAIANQFGVTVEALQEANGITDPASLDVGQVLTVPAPEEASGGAGGPAATDGGSADEATGGAVAAGE